MSPTTSSKPTSSISYDVPMRLRKPVLDIVRRSELPIDDLINLILTHLKSMFYIRERVQLGDKQNGYVIKGMVIRINSGTDKTGPLSSAKLSTEASSLTYDIKLFEKSEIITAVPFNVLRRISRTPSKNLLQSFLQANAKFAADSTSSGHWTLIKKNTRKAQASTLATTSDSTEKNKNGKRNLDSSTNSLKKKQRTNSKAVNIQPVAHKRAKLKKLSNSPKSGVPPIWAKLLKSFPLEPEVLLVRLDDGSPTIESGSSTLKVRQQGIGAPGVSGKENNANNQNKKMKQMTLFDMKPKMASHDIDKQKMSNKVSKPGKTNSVKASKQPKAIAGNQQKRPLDESKESLLGCASSQFKDSKVIIDKLKRVSCVASSKDLSDFGADVLPKSALDKTSAMPANEKVAGNLSIILHRCSPNKLNGYSPAAITVNTQQKDLMTANLEKPALCKTKKSKSNTVSKLVKIAKSGKLTKQAKSSSAVAEKRQQKKVKNIKTEKQTPAGASTSTKDLNVKRISFTDFNKAASTAGVIVKSTKQGTLDGVLAKGIFTMLERKIKPIPEPTLVKTPPGFENEWYGDATMVVQFLISFRNILQPDKSITLTTGSFIEAIMNESEGFFYLNNILVCLLKTFTQGCAPQEHVEAGVSLLDVPITIYSASELTRLYFQETDDKGQDFDEKEGRFVQSLNLLRSMEMHQLCAYDKLNIFCMLCTNVLASYTVNQYISEIRNVAKKLRAEKLQLSQAEKKNKILKMLTEKENNDENQSANGETKQQLDPGNFYGSLATEDPGENKKILQSATTDRRSSLLKAKEEKIRLQKLKQEQALKESEELKKQKVQNDFKKQLQFHEDECKAIKRLKPLGKDREFSRYWLFPNCDPQLVVEKGWWEEMNANDESLMAKSSTLSPKKANLQKFSQKQPNQWYTYETAEEVKKLIASLEMGEGESKLRAHLKQHLSEITGPDKISKPNVKTVEHANGTIDLMEGFRNEIFDLQEKIMEGALGELRKPEAWIANVDKANTSQEFANCLLTLQEAMYPKFLCGAFSVANQDKNKLTTTTKKSNPKKSNLEIWQTMVAECRTLSRLHVLLGMLSACIQWEMSSANTKCKVCRKKSEDTLLLCDSCANGFHLGCLRPRLLRIPRDDWFCPSCKKSREESEEEEEEEESESEEEGDSDGNSPEDCSDDEEDMIASKKKNVVCGTCKRKGDERLMCVKCFKGWHPACHKPPMRNIPRGIWFCKSCRNKRVKKSYGKKKR